MYSNRFSNKIIQCRNCGREYSAGYHDEILCYGCIESIKTEYLKKYPFKIGQPVYTMIMGSKNAAYTVRQYTIHKIKFRNWYFWNEDSSKFDIENLHSHFQVTLKSDKKGYIDRNITEIYATELDCFNANKKAIKTHMVNVAKKQVLQAVEKQLNDGFENGLDDDFIKQLISKTIQESNIEPQKVLALEKSPPEDEIYINYIKNVDLCHKLVGQLRKIDSQLNDIFVFDHPIPLLGSLINQCLNISTGILKSNKALYDLYIKNEDAYLDWMLVGKQTFEKWLEQHKEDNE